MNNSQGLALGVLVVAVETATGQAMPDPLRCALDRAGAVGDVTTVRAAATCFHAVLAGPGARTAAGRGTTPAGASATKRTPTNILTGGRNA